MPWFRLYLYIQEQVTINPDNNNRAERSSMSEDTHPSGEGLCYEDRLPLAWQKLADPGNSGVLARLQADNESLMRLVDAMQTHHVETDDRGGMQPELARLEHKIDVLLTMVGQIREQQIQMPEARDMALYADGLALALMSPDELLPGTAVIISLYLDPSLPRPLQLAGNVENVSTLDDGTSWVFVRYGGLGESVQEAIERLIFRHHRRAVAMAKSIKQTK
jgi:hypothetical protein